MPTNMRRRTSPPPSTASRTRPLGHSHRAASTSFVSPINPNGSGLLLDLAPMATCAPPRHRKASSPAVAAGAKGSSLQHQPSSRHATKENVTVTVRFRPLSPREIRQGEEVSWYADGDTVVRSEQKPNVGYAYDRVFAPTTMTRQVYDVAAQHVVRGAMKGIYGTIFAYGVTSSGKTHTMHGDQRSPGIIPLAVKDAFSIIQETPDRQFLLRVSYLEIYNEVVNDLLNPAGQSLRIREDPQGTFVEGIKEEAVLSPGHALSLIAAGEEHRHVGSTNFNLLSSRSHTIFTLTIESSSYGESNKGEAVTFSQLHLIDLAGSESSRAETTGVRRKEGSYINKSLLTLGTVISKLADGEATHIPFRDSKLTRLLQSSLSGQGRVSLICTVTPASSNSEETHNTLKFAHRAKRIEVQASQNKIIDEKSLIKKYQNEIRRLKEELEQLKMGIICGTPTKDVEEDNIIPWKQKLEDGNVKLQSRLEQEEQAKSALLARIQRLTKLILVSTKATQTSRFSPHPGPRRRHSFGGEEVKVADNRVIQDRLEEKTSECMKLQAAVAHLKEQLSQALQAKDSLSNHIVMQQSSGANYEVQQHSDQEKTVPREISAEPLQTEQQLNQADSSASKEARIQEVEAKLTHCQATCNRIAQEKELLEKHNLWLDEELKAKVKNLADLRKSNMDEESRMSAKIAELEREISEFTSSLRRSKERVSELEQRVSYMEKELLSAKDASAANEQRLAAELSTVMKLAEVHKESSDEFLKKAGQLDGVIKALENIKREHCIAQEVSKKTYEQVSERARKLDEELTKLRPELGSLRPERDKAVLEDYFARDRLNGYMAEIDHQRKEANSVSLRNAESMHLVVDYEKRLRESADSMQALEENSRKLSMEDAPSTDRRAHRNIISIREMVAEELLLLINYGDMEELTDIKGIRDITAENIIKFRSESRFKSLKDLEERMGRNQTPFGKDKIEGMIGGFATAPAGGLEAGGDSNKSKSEINGEDDSENDE